MKRKISFGITLLLMLSLLLLALTACEEKECDHSYQGSVTKAATCESDGVMTYTCSLCTDSYTEVINALGHNGVTDEAVAPTCTKTGLTEGSHCSVCNTVLVEQKTVDKLDHDYSEELICNSTHHYYECECGSRKGEEKHISSGAASATQDEICTKCGYVINEAIGISFKTLTVDGNNVFVKVSNDTTYYSFIDEINAVGGAKYIVSKNITGTDWLPTKTIDLEIGDNIIYIIEMIDDVPADIYTVVIRRRPVYTVTFDANGGTAVETQYVEEEKFAAIPETTYEGYTFTGWNYDFGTPIMSDTHITARWKANTDTKYTVEYYLENLDKSYELIDTDELTGTTDTTAEALIKEFEHFTFNTNKSVVSGNIDGNGILVLKVYYTRNVYKLSSANTDLGSISKSGSYVYGSIEAFEATATVSKLGYEFIGWYSKGVLVSTAQTYIFTAENNVEARFALMQEMANFNFQSTSTTCQITGIKDETVTKIVLPDFVTSIGSYAFYNCTNLTSVTISNSVTSIGEYAFRDCTGLTSVYITDIEAWCKISFASTPFPYAENLYLNGELVTDLVIPDSVTSIGNYAFYGCTSLTSVTIPDSVTSIGSSAFYNCRSLTSVVIPNSVTSIGDGAFYGCTSLKNVTIPDSVITIGDSAFSGCTSLTSVIIPDSVTSIGSSAFSGCSSLKSITLPFVGGSKSATSTSSSTLFGYIFGTSRYTGGVLTKQYYSSSSSSYATYYIPASLKSVTITGGNILYGAFYNCTNLTSVTIGNSVTSIGYWAFFGCSSLQSITLPFVGGSKSTTSSSFSSLFGYIFGTSSYAGGVSTKQYYSSSSYQIFYIPSSLKSVVITGGNIPFGAFSNCTGLASITIPDSVTSIGGRAFSGCTSLTSVTIPDSVTSIDTYAFSDCTGLTSVTIGDGVTSIGYYAFYDCRNLTSVTIGYRVRSIGWDAFSACRSLTSVTISNNVTKIGSDAFYACDSLTIYCKAASQPSGWASDWNSSDCPVVWGYTGSNGVTDDGLNWASVTNGIAICGYSGTNTEIVISEKINGIDVVLISQNAFRGNTTITSVTISDSVTSIGNYAFSGCRSLTSVTIPDSVTSIASYAFDGCTGLTIYCEAASKPMFGWDSNWNYSNCPVVWGYKG